MAVTIGGSGAFTGITSLNSTVSDTELGYVDGVTSAIQTQLNGKVTTPGAWTDWTPTYSASSGTLTSVTTQSAKYSQVGKTVTLQVECKITNKGTATNNLGISLPVTAARGNQVGFGREENLTGKGLTAWILGTATLTTRFVDNTSTIADNYQFFVFITYEAA